MDDQNVVGYNVPMGRIVTTPTRADENNNGQQSRLKNSPVSDGQEFCRKNGPCFADISGLAVDSPLERSCSEPSIFHTPAKKKMRKSLSKVELFKYQSEFDGHDFSEIVKALDIKIDAWQNYTEKETSKSESHLFQGYESPLEVVPRRHSLSKESDTSNIEAKHGRSRSSFTLNFKMRAQKLRQSLRKSVMKRRSSKSSASSSTDLCHYQSRETEV